ncbi:Uridine kinase-like protein 1, chloroplastic [Zea mays]|uniref:Uridine kinase-like protein 1, chloroplastic n=1 Tax=Zea mays TaxID=4577 RepID=A0A3L6FK91_MAIZE|nr:Uridine kinase-like protein 1, chloroplastic [Zea mays]
MGFATVGALLLGSAPASGPSDSGGAPKSAESYIGSPLQHQHRGVQNRPAQCSGNVPLNVVQKYADVIIPRGGDNRVAVDMIVQHIRTKLRQHDLCKIYPNVHVVQSTFQIRGMHTLIRDRDITTPEIALEEQDRNPPFDIGSYGEQILDTLSSRTNNTGTASFSEIVSGRPKFEIARTFSALLQLVNSRSVDLDKGKTTNELVCYTAENPFHVRLIGPNRRPEMEARFARKRVKSPLQNAGKVRESSLAQHECPNKPLRKNGKITVTTATKLTQDGKRRRRSSAHLMQPINLESSG